MPPSLRQQLQILQLAMCASVAIYAVVVFVAIKARAPGEGEPSQVVLYVLAGLAGSILLVVMPSVRRVMLPAGETSPTKLRTGSIVSWALCESVAVNGLVAAFLFHEPLIYLPFGACALAGMILTPPPRAE